MSTSLNIAKTIKVDEFYTLLDDVDLELQHYKPYLENKVVYCCCDNPLYSNFCKYFGSNFKEYKLKKLICSWFHNNEKKAKWAVYDERLKDFRFYNLSGNGSFDSAECEQLIKEADVVVTNPPFSRAQDFIEFLISNNKRFIIVCNRNTIITKRIFPLFLDKKIRFGYGFKGNTAYFMIPESLYGHYSKDVVRKEENLVRFRNVTWITNFNIEVPCKKIHLKKKYNPKRYKKYDQYDAINIDKVTDIPYDYAGTMGVPITILDKFDYSHYELLGLDRFMPMNISGKRFTIKGKEKYARVLIKNKKVKDE